MATTWTVKKGDICSNTAPQKHPAHPKKTNKTKRKKNKTKKPATLTPYNSLPIKYQLKSNHVRFDQALTQIIYPCSCKKFIKCDPSPQSI